MTYHLIGQPSRRPPFSDWKAQVERHIEKRTGWCLSLSGFGLESYYNVGLSAEETANDWIASI